jgi:hypothetical protein
MAMAAFGCGRLLRFRRHLVHKPHQHDGAAGVSIRTPEVPRKASLAAWGRCVPVFAITVGRLTSAGGGTSNKMLEKQARQPVLVVPHHAFLLQKICNDKTNSHAAQLVERRVHRLGALRAVAARNFR